MATVDVLTKAFQDLNTLANPPAVADLQTQLDTLMKQRQTLTQQIASLQQQISTVQGTDGQMAAALVSALGQLANQPQFRRGSNSEVDIATAITTAQKAASVSKVVV